MDIHRSWAEIRTTTFRFQVDFAGSHEDMTSLWLWCWCHLRGLMISYKLWRLSSWYGCFLKWWYPTTMGSPTKSDHFGVFLGYHHLRKHPYVSICLQYILWHWTSPSVWVLRQVFPPWCALAVTSVCEATASCWQHQAAGWYDEVPRPNHPCT